MPTKTQQITKLILLFTFALSATASAEPLKPRMVVLTDVSTGETDDGESLVRLLAHADLLEIEGLVFTTGWSLKETRDDFIDLIHDALNAYEKDLPNLQKRSGQTAHLQEEHRRSFAIRESSATFNKVDKVPACQYSPARKLQAYATGSLN